MKRLFKAILLALVAILVVGMPVLAAVAYRATYTIIESAGTPYTMLPVLELADNQWMANNGFMSASALDTRIETLGGLVKPHMVATNKTLTAVPVPADSQTNLYFTTANSDVSSFDIITGYGGKITVADDASLRLVDNFEIEIDDAYINTDAGDTKNIVYKAEAFKVWVSGAEDITAGIWGVASIIQNLSDVFLATSGVNWRAQTFLTGASAFTVQTVDVEITTLGAAGNTVTVSVQAVDGAGEPDGVILTSDTWIEAGAGAWIEFDVADYELDANTTYAVVLSCDGDGVGPRRQSTAPYADGSWWDSINSGVDWTADVAFDMAFRVEGADYSNTEVTATSVESGQHDIKVWADGADLFISIDSAVAGDGYDTAALAGAVPGNGNNWLIMDNSTTQFMSYMGFYKHTTAIGGSSLKAWYQPNYMVEATDSGGTETAGGSAVLITAAEITEGVDYWVGGLVTITAAAGAAPEGEARVCTASAVGSITVAPAFSANVDIGDTFTVDFGTLIDRSYYGVEFDAADDIIACGAAADMDITDKATLTAWVYIDTDGETNEGSIIDRRDATPDGYRLYVSSEAGGNVAIEAILDCATDAYAKTAVEISTGAWHYIVAVYDRLGTNRWEIYEDGTLLTLGTDTAGVAPITGHTANVMNIGDNAASNRCFDGKIDEPSFYTTAWTQALVTANYAVGAGLYTPTDTTSIALQLHMEEGTGVDVADTSGEVNDGTITNAVWVNGKVPRPAGNAGTNDSRLTWGANPTGVAVTIGGMVSSGQPVPGSIPTDPAQDILPETAVTDWFIEPAVGTTLLTNPLRPFVTMWSDNSTLTELQCWRIYALALILLITVATAISVGRHQGITAIMAGVAILGAVVLTIFPMWALVFAIGMFIGGLVMERSPSL